MTVNTEIEEVAEEFRLNIQLDYARRVVLFYAKTDLPPEDEYALRFAIMSHDPKLPICSITLESFTHCNSVTLKFFLRDCLNTIFRRHGR